MVTLTKEEDVFILDLGNDENRFTPDWIAGVSSALTEVAQASGPRALVTRGEGKFWSNGLDLDWLIANRDQTLPYISSVQNLLIQCLELPVYSIAVLQGHCFAAGALLALSHDTRAMRSDRGFFCLPEVDLGIPFTPGMSMLIQGKLSKRAAHESMTTGRRYGGEDALEFGIADWIAGEEDLVTRAMEQAAPLAAKAGPTLAAIRSRMYADAIASLRSDAGLQIPE
jgi:enoyl-CoA hydratase/carnithine racemase